MRTKKTHPFSNEDVRVLLEGVSAGRTSPGEAFEKLSAIEGTPLGSSGKDPLGVRLDFARESRKGVSEVIYCPGKSDEQLLFIADSVRSKGTMTY